MGTIIALGGGNFSNNEMNNIVKKIIELSEKPNPLILYIPTACFDEATPDDETIICFEKFGCRTDMLFLSDKSLDQNSIRQKIDKCDIIYVFGGNMKHLMQIWKETGTDHLLKEAYNQGKILSGVSSGGMCWFKEGYDDCGENGSYEFIKGLDLIPYINCPHYQSESWQTFGEAIKQKEFSGIAVDNGAGFCYIDGRYSLINGNEGGNCYFYDSENNFKKTVLNDHPEMLQFL